MTQQSLQCSQFCDDSNRGGEEQKHVELVQSGPECVAPYRTVQSVADTTDPALAILSGRGGPRKQVK